tara:strand:+ start:609 stop:845 length:237 start_codon:yes stop_codon:yes gene_type:complete
MTEFSQTLQNLIVFSDSHQSDGLEKSVVLINRLLEPYELRVKLQFVEDYVDDEGEFAWVVSIVPDDLPFSRREEHGKV